MLSLEVYKHIMLSLEVYKHIMLSLEVYKHTHLLIKKNKKEEIITYLVFPINLSFNTCCHFYNSFRETRRIYTTLRRIFTIWKRHRTFIWIYEKACCWWKEKMSITCKISWRPGNYEIFFCLSKSKIKLEHLQG